MNYCVISWKSGTKNVFVIVTITQRCCYFSSEIVSLPGKRLGGGGSHRPDIVRQWATEQYAYHDRRVLYIILFGLFKITGTRNPRPKDPIRSESRAKISCSDGFRLFCLFQVSTRVAITIISGTKDRRRGGGAHVLAANVVKRRQEPFRVTIITHTHTHVRVVLCNVVLYHVDYTHTYTRVYILYEFNPGSTILVSVAEIRMVRKIVS